MSAEAVGWVWKHSPYSDTTLVVHLAIADVVNDANGNEFWMTVAALAEKARCSPDTARRAVRQMTAGGFLEQIDPGGGRSRPARYRFLMPPAETLADARGFRSAGNPGKKPSFSARETLANPRGQRTQENPRR